MITLITISTLLSFAGQNSSVIGNYIYKQVSRKRANIKLLQEINDLKKEQQKLSLVNDFVKYSKTQRKINALERIKEDTNVSIETSLFFKLSLIYGIKFFCALVLLFLSLYYRRTPLFKLDDGIDLTPFNYIISYPNERNYVSFHFWVITCNVAARLLKY